MNMVPEQIVPGLTIHFCNSSPRVSENGEATPLNDKSGGSRKSVSVHQLPIVVCSQPFRTAAVDESDSGVLRRQKYPSAGARLTSLPLHRIFTIRGW